MSIELKKDHSKFNYRAIALVISYRIEIYRNKNPSLVMATQMKIKTLKTVRNKICLL